jgi:hypothetical protein
MSHLNLILLLEDEEYEQIEVVLDLVHDLPTVHYRKIYSIVKALPSRTNQFNRQSHFDKLIKI